MKLEEFDLPCPNCGKIIPIKIIHQETSAGGGGSSGGNELSDGNQTFVNIGSGKGGSGGGGYAEMDSRFSEDAPETVEAEIPDGIAAYAMEHPREFNEESPAALLANPNWNAYTSNDLETIVRWVASFDGRDATILEMLAVIAQAKELVKAIDGGKLADKG